MRFLVSIAIFASLMFVSAVYAHSGTVIQDGPGQWQLLDASYERIGTLKRTAQNNIAVYGEWNRFKGVIVRSNKYFKVPGNNHLLSPESARLYLFALEGLQAIGEL